MPAVVHRTLLIVALALVVLAGGCDSRKQDSKAGNAPPRIAYNGPVVTVHGIVLLSGKPPTMAMIPNQPCHAGAAPFAEETVVTDEAGHLANVVVSIEDAPYTPAPGDAVVLDQKDCRYVPHVFAMRTGQPLMIRSSDDTLHNVLLHTELNPAGNFVMVSAGQTQTVSFKAAETFPVTCDVHPWMKAWIAMFDHSCFAVTSADGSFVISGIPPGRHKIVAWHERYGRLEQWVDAAGNSAPVTFTFSDGRP